MMAVLIVMITFFAMEGVAWFTHKFIMHGFLWYFHSDHHVKDPESVVEKNDFFFLVFAIPSIALFVLWSVYSNQLALYIASGIALYGLAYFLVHDVFIHQRIKIFRRANNPYLKALRKAHKVHHKHLTKEDGECFGMLWVPLKYLKEFVKRKQ